MRQLVGILLLLTVLLPVPADAKRGPKPKVDPVEYQGKRYTPYGDGWRQCVRATEIKTGKTLWDVAVFHNLIIPLLEEDVQWVFIKRMFIDDSKLIVVAEDHRAYTLDLTTGAVKRLKQPPPEKKQANPAAAGDCAVTSCLQVERASRAAPDRHRSAAGRYVGTA